MLNSIEFWSVVISSLIAIAALVQSLHSDKLSQKANQSAEQANILSQKAMEDSEKEFFPIVKFVNDISVEKKDFLTLCNEVTFDFDEELLSGEEEGSICICTKIKNIGDGLLTNIQIDEILIKKGNHVTNDYRYPFPNEQLLHKENCNLNQQLVLSKEDTEVVINFILTNAVSEYKELYSLEDSEQYIKKFFEDNNNITIYMSLQLSSINNSKYKQNFLSGTFFNNKIVRNSFFDLRKK